MVEITENLKHKDSDSQLLYHLFVSRVLDNQEQALHQKEESPAQVFQIDLPVNTGQWFLIVEAYSDGSWSVYFKDFPDIIAGSNVSLDDALDGLSDIILSDLGSDENVSEYLKKRRQFLSKVFGL